MEIVFRISTSVKWVVRRADSSRDAWTVHDLAINQELQHRHRKLMLDRGFLMMWGGRWYVTSAVLDSDTDRTLVVFDQSLATL